MKLTVLISGTLLSVVVWADDTPIDASIGTPIDLHLLDYWLGIDEQTAEALLDDEMPLMVEQQATTSLDKLPVGDSEENIEEGEED